MGQSARKLTCSGDGCRCSTGSDVIVPSVAQKTLTQFLTGDDAELTDSNALQLALESIPKDYDILLVRNEHGYGLLEHCVAKDDLAVLKIILQRGVQDLNSGRCSLPLHIACLNGSLACVKELVKCGASVDIKARMCWPKPHRKSCCGKMKDRRRRGRRRRALTCTNGAGGDDDDDDDDEDYDFDCYEYEPPLRIDSGDSFFYAVKEDQVEVLRYLMAFKEGKSRGDSVSAGRSESECSVRERGAAYERPMLEVAFERKAWKCCAFLLANRVEEISSCRFRQRLNLRSITMQTTLFHVLFLMTDERIESISEACKLLLDNGMEREVCVTDPFGNTPFQSLIIRLSCEGLRNPYYHLLPGWNKTDIISLGRLLLERGGSTSVSERNNGTLATVARHNNNWEICHDLFDILLEAGADPNVTGRDGNFPLTLCLRQFCMNDLSQNGCDFMTSQYLSSLEILCFRGADPNCRTRSGLTPLHLILFTASENMSLLRVEQKDLNFDLINDVLKMLFRYGLDVSGGESNTVPHVFNGILLMVNNSRTTSDLAGVQKILLTLIQYGADPNVEMQCGRVMFTLYGNENPFADTKRHYLLEHLFVILAKKEQLLSDLECVNTFSKILYLLYMSMNQRNLCKCLNALERWQEGVPPESAATILCEIITEMNRHQPRTLKQMARVVNHESVLKRIPGRLADSLRVPAVIREYILNFEA